VRVRYCREVTCTHGPNMVRKVSTSQYVSSNPLPNRHLDGMSFASSLGTLWKSRRIVVKQVRAAIGVASLEDGCGGAAGVFILIS
jgi:hypothetical protein